MAPPNAGMLTDVDVVGTLLPYCDAMFMDNELRALLTSVPAKFKIKETSRVFSMSCKENFLSYLRDLLAQASPEHMAKVREVYGEKG
jgi:hypothetical protein